MRISIDFQRLPSFFTFIITFVYYILFWLSIYIYNLFLMEELFFLCYFAWRTIPWVFLLCEHILSKGTIRIQNQEQYKHTGNTHKNKKLRQHKQVSENMDNRKLRFFVPFMTHVFQFLFSMQIRKAISSSW